MTTTANPATRQPIAPRTVDGPDAAGAGESGARGSKARRPPLRGEVIALDIPRRSPHATPRSGGGRSGTSLAAMRVALLGGLLSVLLVVGLVALGLLALADDPAAPARPAVAAPSAAATPPALPPRTSDLNAAARGAGCTLLDPAVERAAPPGEGVHGHRLSLEPADLGNALPRLVRGRDLPAGEAPQLGSGPYARARTRERAVPAGHGTPRRWGSWRR